MTPQVQQALEVARSLAAAGIPIFTAWPDPSEPTGFKLPVRWQQTPADPRIVDAWQPGMALCAVTGCGLDLVDVDLYKGGDPDLIAPVAPTVYGMATTPSGGVHLFVRSMGVASKNAVLPGIDIKAGLGDGTGRGFAFIAPTVRISKSDGQPHGYQWAQQPDLQQLAQAANDLSGAQLAHLLQSGPSSNGAGGTVDDFMKSGPWENIERTLADGRNNGVAKLAAALRGRGGWQQEDAMRFMYATVWPVIDQEQGGHPFTADEFEGAIKAQWRQYPDGQDQRDAEAEITPEPGDPAPPANPARYFEAKGGLKAATLAGDVTYMGPLAEGVDDRMWMYSSGVWRAAKNVVRDRVTFLLGEKYKRHCASTAEDIVRARVDQITCSPISEVINVRNGLLDWRTGALQAHTPDLKTTVQLNVDYTPDATCPAFDAFLAQVAPPDMIELIWELIGYLMYSGNPLHKAVMLTGKGRNGKGTFLRVLTRLLGGQNVTTVSLHDLVNTRFSTASLFGKLANIAGDIDAGYLENTAIFKAITGGDMISAEHKGRDRFDFVPWAVPVFSANKIPASADTTAGYLSRWLVVPFPNSFQGREDRSLDVRLQSRTELQGIAVKAVAALPRLLERGDFPVTESGTTAIAEFQRRVDQVRTWLHDCADLDPDHPFIARTELYEAYKRWCGRDNHKPVRASEFYDRVESAGPHPTAYRGTRGFTGIKITDQGWAQGIMPTAAPPTPQPHTDSGAAGAGESNSDHSTESKNDHGAGGTQDAGQPSKDRTNVRESAAEAAPQDEAPNTTPDQPKHDSKIKRGADGAETPHPPTRARTHSGGWENQHHLHPEPNQDQKPASHSAAIAAGLLEARAAANRAEAKPLTPKQVAKIAERDAAIRATAGPVLHLPALLVRGASPQRVTVPDVKALITPMEDLTVDVETTGYPIGHRDYALRTIQLGNDELAVDLDASNPKHLEVARKLIAAAPRLHAHSATADLVPLAMAGAADYDEAWTRMYDTVIPAKLADPASTGSDPGLKQLAGAVLGDQAATPEADRARAELFKTARWLTNPKVTTPIERSGWAQVDAACTTQITYAASDVLDTGALAKQLPAVPPDVLERERLAQRMTARVAYRGLRIDGDHVHTMLNRHRAARDTAARSVRDMGVDNPASNQQVGARLLELEADLPRTGKGAPSVAADVLEKLKTADNDAGRLAAVLLEHREHTKAISAFLEPYEQLVTHGDGRARPTVYTLAADTGRMSCVRPNLQQVPRAGGFRACITADPGHRLVSADFAGVELRVAAALSGDANLRDMIAQSIDLHWVIARQVFGPNATKADRYMVKRGVFGRIYGGGIPTLAKQVGCPEPVMAAAVAALDQMLPGLTEWSRLIRDAVQAGRTQMPTHSGRIIHLPQDTPHKAPNFCIQGAARELLVDALVRWQDTEWGNCTLLPVHDELVVMVPEADAVAATVELVNAMETKLHGVPIAAEASTPSFVWSDAA